MSAENNRRDLDEDLTTSIDRALGQRKSKSSTSCESINILL